MEHYYKLVEDLAKQAGGHYRLTTVLLKRVRQLVKGLGGFRSESLDPVKSSFEEYIGGKLQITREVEEPVLAEGKKKG
jgi:DNA-directed RNA polymerase subunit K/omega